MKWSVGVITCPRKNGFFLDKTIRSINNAGWDDSLITIFAEPKSVTPDFFKGNVVERKKQYGDWTNWATGLFELLLSEPEADYFLMSEDDVVYNRDSKRYLELSFPHLGTFGSLSLYTPSRYHKKKFRGWHDECCGMETWSTVTVIMSKKGVIDFFSFKDTIKHRFEDIFKNPNIQWGVKTDPRNSVKDAVLGHWAYTHQLPMYYHTPALAQHIGVNSTITDDPSSVGNGRMAADFVGEDAALQLLEPRVCGRYFL